MPQWRVLLTDYAWPELEIEREILSAAGAELLVAPDASEATLSRLAHEVDAILTCWARVTPAVIEASSRLQIVSRLGIGLDNIAVEHCTARRVVVTNVPDYCLEEVAEHALALLLALGRKVAWYHAQTKQGEYDLKSGPTLRRIAGQTLGIVGLGNIGRRVAEKAQAFGLRVIATSRRGENFPPGIEYRPLNELLSESDYVSLHVPSTGETRQLIGAAQFRLMKPSAYLINTARGAVVDEQALSDALTEGLIAGAALDVQQTEPPDLARGPFNDPRVIVTPHAAFVSAESVAELRRRATQQVVERLRGGTPANVVNPAALG